MHKNEGLKLCTGFITNTVYVNMQDNYYNPVKLLQPSRLAHLFSDALLFATKPLKLTIHGCQA